MSDGWSFDTGTKPIMFFEMMKKILQLLLVTVSTLVFLVVIGGAISQKSVAGEKMETATEAPEQPEKPVEKTDEEWKKELTEEQYVVLRKSGTERPNGKVYKEFKEQGAGTYYCAGCNAELFSSKEKFDSRCGWPSFYDPANAKNVKTVADLSGGMVRTEVKCAICDGHLGHVFEGEGFPTPTDQRYCINGVALKFVPDKAAKSGEKDAKKPEKKK